MKVAPINLAYNPHTLWFDPQEIEVHKGQAVVVETARGIELGRMAAEITEVSDEEIEALKSPLKPVLRVATDEDIEFAAEMEQKSREALPDFKRMVEESEVEMHPVSVEFLLDGDKAVFYFEAEERVDFRDLVRKLAAHFHVRIDMRQIGVRDEARIVGGLGHCGQELCCKRMGGEFNPVSIRMAKEQDLSLNPQKISGLCGRLMCCLRYEYDAYKDFKQRAPKVNATVQTPQGVAKVVELDVPREIVCVRIDEEKPVRVPLAAFEEAEEGARPHVIGEDAWAEATAEAVTGYTSDSLTFVTSQFTGADKLAEGATVRHTGSNRAGGESAVAEPASEAIGRKRRNRSNRGSVAAEETVAAASVDESRKPRRRRSTKISGGEIDSVEVVKEQPAEETKPVAVEPKAGSEKPAANKPAKDQGVKDTANDAPRNKSRRGRRGGRKHSGNNNAGQQQNASQQQPQSQQPQQKQDKRDKQDRSERDDAPRVVRPGQKSSGLARKENAPENAGQAKQGKQDNTDDAKQANAKNSHRRSRRRSHPSKGSNVNGAGNNGNSANSADNG